jgi:phosphatidylserine/phosphatidylglycerophosphate/cardiolipin synthase-like enzyme
MKKTIASFLILMPGLLIGQTNANPIVEIVESIPVETVLDNPDIRNTTEVWVDMINRATRTIDLEHFYVSPQKGEPLDTVIGALLRATRRGVQIRFIVDKRMYRTYPAMVDSFGRMNNIQTRIIDLGTYAGGIQHAKLMLIDRREVFFGSQNFDWRALKHIHELGLKIANKEIAEYYQDIFDLDWNLAAINNRDSLTSILKSKTYPKNYVLAQNGEDTLYLHPTASPRTMLPDTTTWDEPAISNLLGGAKVEIVLQFLSYSPVGRDKKYFAELDSNLRLAAARGVKVKMIIADWEKASDAEQYLKDLSTVPNVAAKYSAIPEWSGGYVSFARVEHCKFILVDRKAFWLGTSNGERSYFHTSRNLGVVIVNNKLAESLNRIFYKSWDGPYVETIKPSVLYKPRNHGEH